MFIELNEIEARIVGCLIEKENTTPDYYPLTLNALTNACNQKSNRNPVVSYDEATVEEGLDSLLSADIVYLFYGSGSRTPKYKHLLPKVLRLSHPETAVICVLLLRGAQTLGELNQRTSRIYEFSGLDAVSETVDSLLSREEPLILKLPKQPGQKEARFAHLLSGEIDIDTVAPQSGVVTAGGNTKSRLEEMEERVLSLETELETLKNTFEEFRNQFE